MAAHTAVVVSTGTIDQERAPHRWVRRPAIRLRDDGTGDPPYRLWRLVLLFAAISAAVVGLAVARGTQISITDEPAHADYAYAIAHGSVPAKGDLITDEIRYEWYCHDLRAATPQASCDAYPASFQAGAQDYTFGDPPVYYLVTGPVARLLDALVPGGHHFVTFARIIGAVWLFAAILVFYLALREFRVGWRYAALGALLLPLCPGMIASSSQITSDAPAALCGAAALWLLARITVGQRTGWVLPFVLTALATGTKILNGMPMLVVGAVTAVLAVQAARRRDWLSAGRQARVGAAVGAGFVGTYLGWLWFQSGRGQDGWSNPNAVDALDPTGSKAGDLLSNLFGTFEHLTTNYWLSDSINGETVVIWATLLGVLLVAAPLCVMTLSRSGSWSWVLGVATFGGISAVALVVEAQVYLTSHQFFAVVAGRYALSFLPWAIACLAVVATRRRMLRSGTALVAVGLTVLLLSESGLFTLGPALSSHTPFLVG
jgi:4-amino-4-deoxy-L-arabinose transferase-like glycosyltransferase